MGQGESEVTPPIDATAPARSSRRARPLWFRSLAGLAMVPLLGFIGLAAQTLWADWASLRDDLARERDSLVVGYKDISPEISYAASPANWTHDEGDASLLWACWKDGEHQWFRFSRGEIDARRLTMPMGRDVIRAIDYPVYEHDGGPTWVRVPHDAAVVGFERDGSAVAYPVKVLRKVLMVNDQLGDRPVLVAYTPDDGRVSVYEATLDGRRLTLGHGGYFLQREDCRGEGSPVFYDRGTRSLWSEGEEGMVALAGPRKGTSLKRVATPDVVAWADWKSNHPDGQLVVGADRSKGMPID